MPMPLVLPRELTVYTVGELRPLWRDWIDALVAQMPPCAHGVIDASAVDEVDAAGVQLLVSLSRGLANAHVALHLAHASAALVAACGSLGLPHLFAPVLVDGAQA